MSPRLRGRRANRDGVADEENTVLYWVLRNGVIGPLVRVFFRPRVSGLEHVPATGGVLVASNHLSFSDSIFVPVVLSRRISYPAKKEYFTGTGLKGRFLRWFFAGTGQVPIDRSGGEASTSALQAGIAVLRAGGVFGIYPEGTRSPDGRLYRGKTGVARMALAAGVPVVPVGMIDTDKAQPRGRLWPKPMRIGIRIGEPLDFSSYAGRDDDRQALREITDTIMAAIRELSGQTYVDTYAPRPAPVEGPPA